MSKSVFCTATVSQAETIIDKLRAAGFSNNDISVLMADKDGTKDFAVKHHTKAPEGAVPVPERVLWSAEPWVGWLASDRWRFLVSAPLSLLARSWLL